MSLLFTKTIIVQEVNVPVAVMEQLLVSLLMDNRVRGDIHRVNSLLESGERLDLICINYLVARDFIF